MRPLSLPEGVYVDARSNSVNDLSKNASNIYEPIHASASRRGGGKPMSTFRLHPSARDAKQAHKWEDSRVGCFLGLGTGGGEGCGCGYGTRARVQGRWAARES